MNPALGVNPTYCVPRQTVLCMKEKVWSLSGDSFHITDEHGTEIVQCRGQTFSLSDRKEFADAAGRPLFSLRTKHFSLHKSFYAEDAQEKVLFEVKGKFSSEFFNLILIERYADELVVGSSKMIATFTNTSNKAPVELVVKGDWFDRSAKITMGDVVVATIGRSFFNLREIFGDQQTVSRSLK
jgi:uncharacterized protein YxjI